MHSACYKAFLEIDQSALQNDKRWIYRAKNVYKEIQEEKQKYIAQKQVGFEFHFEHSISGGISDSKRDFVPQC